MGKLKINSEIEVYDEKICGGCEFMKLKYLVRKEVDSYGIEVKKNVIMCANKELCAKLAKHLEKQIEQEVLKTLDP